MQKIIFALFFVSSSLSFGQSGFKWEKIDSVKKSKSQIYSETKMFISEYWKSGKDIKAIIQKDDKRSSILVKCNSVQKVVSGSSKITLYYSYDVKFLMKEGKYTLIEDNLNYIGGISAVWENKDLKPTDKFPGLAKAGINEKAWTELMKSLRSEMQGVINSYEKYINGKL